MLHNLALFLQFSTEFVAGQKQLGTQGLQAFFPPGALWILSNALPDHQAIYRPTPSSFRSINLAEDQWGSG
jgi:hypothetical protein